MAKVVIVGGGWAGCASAVAAAKKQVEVVVLERTDMLLGTGLVGGIMRNNGRFTATEEAIALGCGDLFQLTDQEARHKNIEFPGHKHASLYDVATMEPTVKKYLQDQGVEIHFQARVAEVEMEGKTIKKVMTAKGDAFNGDAFIDTTGTAGPMNNCTRHGNGCACCILRCPSFGGRVSLTAEAGVEEIIGVKKDGSVGAMSGSCKLFKESLDSAIVEELNRTGVAIIPIPPDLMASEEKLTMKACQQYALKEFAENIILLDTGHAKLMTPYFPLELLRKIPGMGNARYEDPYAGGLGNSMRYMGMAPRNDALQVEGVNNLFCAGEKAGLLVGHTEAIVTGSLAGYNAACQARSEELLILPDALVIGDAIAFVRTEMQTEEGKTKKYTFSGSVLFERMKQKGYYSTNLDEIRGRVANAGLMNVMLG
ncbi:glucose-inhibited division protein A [Candidatus Vecturithrix granuli]|uniref:Glucose-inhibited division protein A n=1 Tax=Vecturithrix granuli TaxID=1499967 RepID=A0A0S6W6S2_VECG1|nr:glucose-inhibited division protein A [Candidatus Vecturithrix granuli]